MKATPVSRYKTPRYPTRLQALADRTLLEKHVPPAWKSRAEMAGVVTLLLATNSCTSLAQKVEALAGKPAVVAPIFQHGEGRGAVGCVVINPPVFLSEQDAMQVIKEELAKSGVVLSNNNVPLEGVEIAQSGRVWSTDSEGGHTLHVNRGSKRLVLEGLDPRKKVGIEFVTAKNYFDLGGEQSSSTVQDYDLKAVAASVDGQVKAEAHDLYFEAFYDPIGAWPRDMYRDQEFRKKVDALYKEREQSKDPKVVAEKDKEIEALYDQKLAPARAESKRLLRMQVKDFVDWLKGQGVI